MEVSTRGYPFLATHKPSLGVTRSHSLPPEVAVWLLVGHPFTALQCSHPALGKPTHRDRYLDFWSHHTPHVKGGLVRCLFDRARSVISTQDNLQKEECHLAKVLKQSSYPGAFIRSSLHPPRQECPQDSPSKEGDRPLLVVLPYTTRVSENIRRVCQKFGKKMVFRSSHSLRSMLTKVKDALPVEKQVNVVYWIPCSCGKAYIGKTKQRLETLSRCMSNPGSSWWNNQDPGRLLSQCRTHSGPCSGLLPFMD